MGLDMYLYRKNYVKNWEHMRPEEKHQITIKRDGKVRKDIKPARIKYIVEEVGYWRKANAIHQWFVSNVQNGTDDCGTYYVDSDKLKELRDLCKTVLASSEVVEGKVVNGQSMDMETGKMVNIYEDGKYMKDYSVAAELLPTAEGFFFGGTDYDQWYIEDLEQTVKIIDKALENTEDSFEYSSSW